MYTQHSLYLKAKDINTCLCCGFFFWWCLRAVAGPGMLAVSDASAQSCGADAVCAG